VVRPLLLAIVLAVAAPAAAQARPFTIEVRGNSDGFGRVLAMGDFKPERDPTLAAAIDAYGDPATVRSIGGDAGCRVAWPGLGVRILFVNLGGGSACDPPLGKAQEARIHTVGSWRTVKGLHIGDRRRKLRRLDPRARRHRRTYWLTTGINLFGVGQRPYPVLSARIRGDRIASFKLEIGAAGE
jgi:hypothetical protein